MKHLFIALAASLVALGAAHAEPIAIRAGNTGDVLTIRKYAGPVQAAAPCEDRCPVKTCFADLHECGVIPWTDPADHSSLVEVVLGAPASKTYTAFTAFRMGCGASIIGPATIFGPDGSPVLSVAAGEVFPAKQNCAGFKTADAAKPEAPAR